jgi:hypothetical protein
MPHVPKRPPALAHVSDEAASIVLARHFGDFVAAARDLGVDRKDLRRLSWHNPRILNAAHERMDLFHGRVKSKIIEALHSGSAKRRRWAADAMFDAIEFSDSPFASARVAPPPRPARVAAGVRLVLGREAAAELARERVAEVEADRRLEHVDLASIDAVPEPSFNWGRAPQAQAGSLWPAGIRRPSRGRRWR